MKTVSDDVDVEFDVSKEFAKIKEGFYTEVETNTSKSNINDENEIDFEVLEVKDDDLIIRDNANDPLATFDAAFCEFPIAHLTTRLPKSVDKNFITYSDTIKVKGIDKKRDWLIGTASKHGLGGPSTIDLFYHIMQIWDEQGFENKRICLGSINSLLTRMGLNRSKRYYDMIKKDLDRLTSLKIDSKNGYYDPIKDKYLDVKLEIFQDMEIEKENEDTTNGKSVIYLLVADRYHSIIKYRSQRSGLPFNDEFFNNLNAIEKKLALFLSKMFSPLKQKRMERLCRFTDELASQLPIVLPSIYKVNEKLRQTCEGLIEKNFPLLKDFDISKHKYKKNKFLITFYNNTEYKVNDKRKNFNTRDEIDKIINHLKDSFEDFNGDYNPFYLKVANHVPFDLVYKCVSECKADGDGDPKLFTSIIKKSAVDYF